MLVMWEITGRYRSIGEVKMVEKSWKSYPYNLKKNAVKGNWNRSKLPIKLSRGIVYQNGPEDLPPGGFFTWIEFFLPLASSSTSATPKLLGREIQN